LESLVFLIPWQSLLVAAQELMVTINTAIAPHKKMILFMKYVFTVKNQLESSEENGT
jgi:hypothetical protein